ncbi:MAG: AraC family transcriptional activator of pobA [Flavobacteriaceae bacterium]|jgi:AraC family transcriptional activator of pobA
MKDAFPIYSIKNFETLANSDVFYANQLNSHVKTHHFTEFPHKHDFYLTVLITHGIGRHEVDFESYNAERGVLFMLKPGQMHYWKFSDDIEGFVFFHNANFFDEGSLTTSIKDFEFFASLQNPPVVHLSGEVLHSVENSMNELVEEYTNEHSYKWTKIRALMNLIYIEVGRNYTPIYHIDSQTYLTKVRQFEALIEVNFKSMKFARDYASQLNISEKHLNRIVKNCLNKTSTSMIQDRVLLEAKRMLMHSKLNVSEISAELRFSESSYFIRFFKQKTGITPLGFVKQYTRN